MPAAGHALYILSIRLERAGLDGGSSLAASAEGARTIVGSGRHRQLLERKLTSAGYRDTDALHYTDRLIFADRPRLIRVDEGCPRIVPTMIEQALSARIDQLSYRVNLEGLGVTEGSDEFDRVLPGLKVEQS